MQITRYILRFYILLYLCSCAPMVVEYYQASAPGGTLVGPSSCSRLLGPRTGIEFNNDGLTLQVVAKDKTVFMLITVPDGESAVFLNDRLEFRRHVDALPIKLKLSNINYNHYSNIDTKPLYEDVEIKPTDMMVGKIYELSWVLKQPRLHSASVSMETSLPDDFYVKLPSIRFRDKDIDYPLIKFVKKKSVGMYSVNC